MHERSLNPSRFLSEINLSLSGTRLVLEFRLDLFGVVGMQRRDLASLLESSDVEIFSVGELVRWLSKPPDPLAMQTHELKMKVAPRGGVMVLKAKVTIELADELTESLSDPGKRDCL